MLYERDVTFYLRFVSCYMCRRAVDVNMNVRCIRGLVPESVIYIAMYSLSAVTF